jgi:glucosamine 6-phosphate synthetase-like amidotransferase/phosphosugar isomerase protein
MCGIIGFIGEVPEGHWDQTYRIMGALFLAAQHRGEHATGLAAAFSPYKRPDAGQMVFAKQPLPANLFLRVDPLWRQLQHRRCAAIVGHVRWATHGSPTEPANNHPFVSKGLAVVHNGVLNNHRELADRHNLRLVGECDSEVILRMVERAADPVAGLASCLHECKGSMAVAAYDQRRGAVHLARNSGRPLWLARLKNDRRIFFASTESLLLNGLRAVLGRSMRLDLLVPVAENAVHTLTSDGAILSVSSVGLRSSA